VTLQNGRCAVFVSSIHHKSSRDQIIEEEREPVCWTYIFHGPIRNAAVFWWHATVSRASCTTAATAAVRPLEACHWVTNTWHRTVQGSAISSSQRPGSGGPSSPTYKHTFQWSALVALQLHRLIGAFYMRKANAPNGLLMPTS
jgi:hypothetical protein